ncbi:hypothetical protein COLO4_25355 [Corchorus olitorius]|uniref:Uncharacterized protein n=1 Tax=Corchorus olitorius TaxID=93759 RepID=A0A1R3I3D0_9ROSI|nr:hypothetical protein COLO4_25355 [Corchorus olitorius]
MKEEKVKKVSIVGCRLAVVEWVLGLLSGGAAGEERWKRKEFRV